MCCQEEVTPRVPTGSFASHSRLPDVRSLAVRVMHVLALQRVLWEHGLWQVVPQQLESAAMASPPGNEASVMTV